MRRDVVLPRASSLSLGRTSSMRQGPFTPKGSSSAGVPFAGLLASPFRRMNSDDSQRSSAGACLQLPTAQMA